MAAALALAITGAYAIEQPAAFVFPAKPLVAGVGDAWRVRKDLRTREVL